MRSIYVVLDHVFPLSAAYSSQLRGEALSNAELIRDVHNSFARASPFIDETQRVATEEDDVYHFIAYASINDTLFELDGLQAAPISHGECSIEDFPAKVIPVLQRRIERYPAQEIRFNLLAMVRDLRLRARELGDQALLYHEEQKRNAWLWENALRRHNFVGFVSEMLKGVTRAKVRQGGDAYSKWIADAQEQTQKRMATKKGKGTTVDQDDL
jgi:ubiquitin carboxyl-terminal hydrolase L5